MKITKYEHACLDIKEANTRLIIDPGKFTKSFNNFDGIQVVVITHIHSDHFNKDIVKKIIEKNPEVLIFSCPQVTNEVNDLSITSVSAGDNHVVGDIVLEFFGGRHEFYDDYENIAVLVNDKLLHPGDSYTTADKPVKLLALPASAPWLRVADTVKYAKSVKPETAFPIHNSLLSEIGEMVHYSNIESNFDDIGINWQVLEPGQSVEV